MQWFFILAKQSAQVFAFPEEEISAIKHTIYDLFTKFTLLFTIQTPALKDIKVISLDQFDIYEKYNKCLNVC
jgi:hypothetical protein